MSQESKRDSRARLIFNQLADGKTVSKYQIEFLENLEKNNLKAFWKALITF